MSNIKEIPSYNKIPQKTEKFINKLTNYLSEEEIILYGSILRSDYVYNKSDIDIAIFTNNESSTIYKLAAFLHTKQNNFNNIIWKLKNNIIYGYKIKCDKIAGINCEISIYNTSFKDVLIEEYTRPNNWSLITYILLFILKFFHYTIPILSQKYYSYLKRTIMKNNKGSEFLLL